MEPGTFFSQLLRGSAKASKSLIFIMRWYGRSRYWTGGLLVCMTSVVYPRRETTKVGREGLKGALKLDHRGDVELDSPN